MTSKTLQSILILISLSTGCSLNFTSPLNAPKIQNGTIDLSTWDFDRQGPITLKGEWIASQSPAPLSDKSAKSVHPKSGSQTAMGTQLSFAAKFGRELSGLSLSVEGFPRSKVICESDLGGFVSAGRISQDPSLSKSVRASYVIDLPTGTMVRCNLSMYLDADTFLGDTAGVWRAPRIGNGASIRALNDNDFISSAAFFGLLFTLALYFAIHWLFQRHDTQAAFATVLSTTLGLWYLSTFSLWQARLDSTFAAFFILITIWGIKSFSNTPIDKITRLSMGLMGLLAVFNIFVRESWVWQNIKVIQGLTLIAVPGAIRLINKWWRKSQRNYEQRALAIAFTLFLLLSASDTYFDVLRTIPTGILQIFLLLFMLTVTYAIAKHAVQSRQYAEEVIDSLTSVNEALNKFVPTEFLRMLGKGDVTEAKLGESKTQVVSVLVADIRNFSAISELMNPEQKMSFLNECLSKLSPKIRENNGFIDRYIGDSIMAIFPKSSDDAVRAAVAMHREMDSWNGEKKWPTPIELGIGVHRGEVVLGTIGEEQRYEATLLAPVVNITTDLESLAMTFQSKILISDEIFKGLSNDLKNESRWIGDFVIQGVTSALKVFEVFSADPNHVREFKLFNRDRFEFALSKYQRDEPFSARSELDWIAEDCPEDSATQWWVTRIKSEETLRPGIQLNRRALHWEEK